MSLIAPDNVTALAAVIFGLAWLGFWADRHPVARKVSGVPWVLTVALLLSNTRVIPLESPAYGFVGTYLLPLGIPFLLFTRGYRKTPIEQLQHRGSFDDFARLPLLVEEVSALS